MFSGNVANGLKQFLCPIGYWRFPVFGIVDQLVRGISHDTPTILDIGSPKLLSIYFAACLKSEVHATDIQDRAISTRYEPEFRSYASVFGASGDYRVALQDARRMEYDDNSFDVVYSISVIEHIPDEGDSEAVREIGRVLKPGGIAVIEIPYAKKERNTFVEQQVYERRYTGESVFYQRHYDDESLQRRLVSPSQLRLLSRMCFIERYSFELYWSKIPELLKVPFLWLEPVFSSVNHTEFSGFNGEKGPERTGCGADAVLILKKPD